jgi:tetratricopeptide (TPR) repeat protein
LYGRRRAPILGFTLAGTIRPGAASYPCVRVLVAAFLSLLAGACTGASEARSGPPVTIRPGHDAAPAVEVVAERADACSGLAAVSGGEPADAELDEARTAFTEAVTAFQEGRYDAALDAFCRAYRAVPAVALLYNIAVTYDRLGRGDEAATFYERFADGREREDSVADDARERARALREAH